MDILLEIIKCSCENQVTKRLKWSQCPNRNLANPIRLFQAFLAPLHDQQRT